MCVRIAKLKLKDYLTIYLEKMENQIKKISLDLVDDPAIAMRSNVDADDIEELMFSMRTQGLIEPIVVRPKSDRYEIIVGHRRTRAAQLLHWPVIEAKIVEADDEQILAMRLAENLSRHNVDPVDEACFIGEIIEKYNFSVDEMTEKMHRSKSWIEDRLEIFSMPKYLQEYLKLKRISLGAALWINRIDNGETARYYANWAALNGVSVLGAKKWHDDLKANNYILPMSDVQIRDEGGTVQHVRKTVICAKCDSSVFLDEADVVWIHRICPTE